MELSQTEQHWLLQEQHGNSVDLRVCMCVRTCGRQWEGEQGVRVHWRGLLQEERTYAGSTSTTHVLSMTTCCASQPHP